MFLIDSHCHLDIISHIKDKNAINFVLNKAMNNNVNLFLTIATSIDNFINIKKKISNYNNILYSCGIHPLYQHTINKKTLQTLYTFAKKKSVIALGESGLDYFHQMHNKENQKKLFRQHIQISISVNKPIIVHTRNAMQDTLTILQEEKAEQCQGIIHSFTGDINDAKKILDMGFYISFSGIITFKNTDIIQQVLKYIPLNRLLIETDSPYLSPVPKRGRENQPAYLKYIADYIAKLRKINIEHFTNTTNKNFYKLFKINKKNF
ncbi:MAG TPA: YchF/TatD family DNA exonuclease [Buchnera sp. (in: enterobacteria)]|nr:YchF/TatD family DNA exonuclease [Buchnera sp. (in: enterobacteria)]